MTTHSVDDYKARLEENYREDRAPWDTGQPCSEVVRRLASGDIPTAGRALDIGCGSGTQSILLLEHGLEVVGADISDTAIGLANRRVEQHARKNHARFVAADVANLRDVGEPFDVVLDRGCYHQTRLEDLEGYQRALERLTAPGTVMILLAFNASETPEYPELPCVSEAELRAELGDLFDLVDLRPIRLDRPRGFENKPLFWSALLRRR